MFFTHFNQIAAPGVDYNLTISKTADGRLVVALLPKARDLKDPAQNRIAPLTLSGLPHELDQGFFPAITTPIQKASGLLVGMAEFEKQLDKAAKESKEAKENKASEGKAKKEETAKLTKEEKVKKDKYDGHIKKAGEHEAAGNFDAAILQLQQARLSATDETTKTVDEKIAAIKVKMNEGTLFGTEPSPAQQSAASAPVPAQSAQPMAATTAPAPMSGQQSAATPVPMFAPAQAAASVPQAGAGAQVPDPASVYAPQPAAPGYASQPAAVPAPEQAYNPAALAGGEQAPMGAPAPLQTQASAPTNGYGYGMFGGQPQPQPVPQAPAFGAPQPVSANYPPYAGMPPAAIPVYRESDYAEFEDFPPEMLPQPVVPTNPNQRAA